MELWMCFSKLYTTWKYPNIHFLKSDVAIASLSSPRWIHQYVPKHIWIAQNAQRLSIDCVFASMIYIMKYESLV